MTAKLVFNWGNCEATIKQDYPVGHRRKCSAVARTIGSIYLCGTHRRVLDRWKREKKNINLMKKKHWGLKK